MVCRVITLLVFLSVLMVGEARADEILPFNERNGLKYVTVYLNDLPMELVFDTGANNIVLNKDALQRLGINAFNEAHRIESNTAGGTVAGYIITINSIRAGNVQKRDYPAAFVPAATENLLGATFFSDYSYFVDQDNKVIRLVPRGKYFFDQPEPPVDAPPPAPAPPAAVEPGSGRIEVEMDGVKYIYDGDKLVPLEGEVSK